MRFSMNIKLFISNVIKNNILYKCCIIINMTISRSILVATGLQSVMILSFSSLSSLFRLFKILFLSKMIFKYPRPPPRRDKRGINKRF